MPVTSLAVEPVPSGQIFRFEQQHMTDITTLYTCILTAYQNNGKVQNRDEILGRYLWEQRSEK
jgi:hypothetical protein